MTLAAIRDGSPCEFGTTDSAYMRGVNAGDTR